MHKKTFFQKAKTWLVKNNLFGSLAFNKYVIYTFIEALQSINDNFVFKGGNLLWHYIKTPRDTIDLDLATLSINNHEQVKDILEQACDVFKDIKFKIIKFNEVKKENLLGASVTLAYETDTKQKNQIEIDIVYALNTDIKMIKSPLGNDKEIIVASLENIIVDKLATCYRFGSGNTRMKDFDDLYRIAKFAPKLDHNKMSRLLKRIEIEYKIDENWMDAMFKTRWFEHAKKHKDLPKNIEEVFEIINDWLRNLSKKIS